MKIRILNAEPEEYSGKARQILQAIGEVVEEPVSQHKLAEKLKGFDVLIVRVGLMVTRDILEVSNRVKIIMSATTGLDHIDLKTTKERGITVLSLQGERKFLQSIPATAEHTWALLLSLMRRIPWAFEDVCRGRWDRNKFRGHNLEGKHLGVLGLGRIGQQVAKYGLSFGMKVGAWDPFCEKRGKNIKYFKTLKDFLSWTEILSIHIPLNEKTKGVLDNKNLRLLPKGAMVVNTSRGAILNEKALAALLEKGHISGGAVDVLSNEQMKTAREQSLLLQYARTHDNLIITPHLGGATVESMQQAEVFMAKKLRQFVKDHRLWNERTNKRTAK